MNHTASSRVKGPEPRIAARQTEIADKTREIAADALGRPYILVETARHNHTEWRSGDPHLMFWFSVRNYGSSPAIIKTIHANVLLTRDHDLDRKKSHDFYLLSRDPLSLLPDAAAGRQPGQISTVVLRQDGISREFRQTAEFISPQPVPPLIVSEPSGAYDPSPEPDIRRQPGFVWLVGMVTYESMLGRTHQTSFCYRGVGGGSAEETYGEPYNKRT